MLNPTLTVWQLTFGRSVVSMTSLVFYQRSEFMPILKAGLEGNNWGLIFRTLQGSASIMLAYYTLSIFPTSIVGISNSLQPLIVVFLAFILLKEKLTAYDLF